MRQRREIRINLALAALLVVAGLAVFLAATTVGSWWDQPQWTSYLFGLAAGVSLSAGSIWAAVQ